MLPGYSVEVVMYKEECRKIILEKVEPRDLLEQLAEESAELAQAALKHIRTSKDSKNPTTVTYEESMDALIEEAMDVILLLDLFIGVDTLATANEHYYKWARWVERLEEADGKAD